MQSAIGAIRLSDFRAYDRAELICDGRCVYLFGPNGAGKTNLLEALSFLSPGRGLRGAGVAEVGRRAPGEAQGRAWAVAVEVATDGGVLRVGTGLESAASPRRQVRIEGESVAPGALTEVVRPMWLTPAQDRLFLDPPSERRRFLDRLALASDPRHGAHAGDYDRALRERGRLLAEGADPAWIAAVEIRLAASGARLAAGRARTVRDLRSEIDARADRPFPRARLTLTGPWEQMADAGEDEGRIEAELAEALARGRSRDAAAGRALTGPHRGDLAVVHLDKDRPAADCSTGEQKALILNLVLAQAARLSRTDFAPTPIVLLDEVAAHLDPVRRASLFDEIEALALQAFMTGTDEALFEALKGRALGVHVDASRLTVLEQ